MLTFKLKRNGRIWTKGSNRKNEEVLDIIIYGKKIGRGLCYSHFRRYADFKLKKGEEKTFILYEQPIKLKEGNAN